MRGNYQPLTLAEIKEMDIVEYLATVGHEPVKVRRTDHWYLSPLRNEKTASFKVNRKLNRWYDHGIGRGGNLVDFAIEFYSCSVGEVIKMFGNNLSLQQPRLSMVNISEDNASNAVQILSIQPISARSLFRYLESRKISQTVAKEYCQQVQYQIGGRQYFALGFQNDLGGYELRNSFSKVSSSPKSISTIKLNAQNVSVFEGFFDFLSYQALLLQTQKAPGDYVILNSISLFDRARPFMEKHRHINLYLDRDQAGRKCCEEAMSISEKYKDASGLYEGFKDLNEWLISSY
ncbi:toprim domain-containing protein [Dyadobacter chenhuakuii]|uniref:Toprim domain-containing protein n=1 Tax=Dyadobacter chenhuakuii TaxID=2909339 RepID=A0A9X1Q935_9BACT|nr:toprim domain-containing protein [Dyadobacter chenhuakuii]MCF2496754.1 toprim domain-containing protein [Dyadobacter chenhuakuii]